MIGHDFEHNPSSQNWLEVCGLQSTAFPYIRKFVNWPFSEMAFRN